VGSAFSWSAPLQWPRGEKRTSEDYRSWGAWRRMDPSAILYDLDDALRKLGARNVVITTTMAPGRSGRPSTDDLSRSQRIDPGAAIYLRRGERDLVFAVDRYLRPIDNLRAITLAIEAIRTVERYGGPGMEDRALAGFAALPAEGSATSSHWSVVLGMASDYEGVPRLTIDGCLAMLDRAERAYRELVRKHHPDVGGSHEALVDLNRAIAEARIELGGDRG
jgi:hypothetical protein